MDVFDRTDVYKTLLQFRQWLCNGHGREAMRMGSIAPTKVSWSENISVKGWVKSTMQFSISPVLQNGIACLVFFVVCCFDTFCLLIFCDSVSLSWGVSDTENLVHRSCGFLWHSSKWSVLSTGMQLFPLRAQTNPAYVLISQDTPQLIHLSLLACFAWHKTKQLES